ncbi:hypothetical protein CDL15_Pgr022106 [Punica granatum]|uniref:Uncharacterized protein n=1 Tax=Punica granatum TaxID=22663 RepID=A0A218VTL8_PUNGR|nr:hypothetical protein CDL15_Pgr022106 [Punica granatum]
MASPTLLHPRKVLAILNAVNCPDLPPEAPSPTLYFIPTMAFIILLNSTLIPLHSPTPALPTTPTAPFTFNTPLAPQDAPPPSRETTMDPTDLSINLVEMFNAYMSMALTAEVLDLSINEEEAPDFASLTLLIKPFGFKIPPPKLIIPRLIQIWTAKKGVSIILDD